MRGRRKPYTETEIRRLPCARCGQPAVHQWQICADGNLWRPICENCDVAINEMVLKFMGDKQVDAKIDAYRKLRGV